MPYIKKEKRIAINNGRIPENAGELNYWITENCRLYAESKGEKYQVYNDIIGALEGVKLELYRRKVSIYEDKKAQENGDVY